MKKVFIVGAGQMGLDIGQVMAKTGYQVVFNDMSEEILATQVGKLYARTVLNAYYADKITARDTSGYLLNLKAKNFGKLERWCF